MRNSFKIVLFHLCLLLILSCSFVATAHQKGHRSQRWESPDKRYTLIRKQRTYADGGIFHDLYLKDALTEKRKKIYSCVICEDVIWSPTGEHLAINEHQTSSNNECYIFSVNNGKMVDIGKELYQQIGENDWNIISGNDHVFIRSVEWLDQETLKIQVTGHGKPQLDDGFTLWYQYTLNKGFQKLGFVAHEISSHQEQLQSK